MAVNNCELPQRPEVPRYIHQNHLRMLQHAAQAIVHTLQDKSDATIGEINLAKECESILTRIVSNGTQT